MEGQKEEEVEIEEEQEKGAKEAEKKWGSKSLAVLARIQVLFSNGYGHDALKASSLVLTLCRELIDNLW